MEILFLLLSPLIYVISWLTPKSDRIWCCGAWFGEKYADNSRYFFEYLADNSKVLGVDPVWISKNHDIVHDIRKSGRKSFYYLSLAGILAQLKSRHFVCSVNSRDFYFATLTPRNRIIQLWHGSPLKKIGFDTLRKGSFPYWKNRARQVFLDHYDCILSPSITFDQPLGSAFLLHENSILRSGYPRCDGLFLTPDRRAEIRQYLAPNNEQMAIYLPTHRGEGANNKTVQNMLLNFFEHSDSLKEMHIKLIAKPHFYDLEKILPITAKTTSSNVSVVADFGKYELYEVLAASDMLITDYSSVFLDYEITGKPVFFLAPDLEWYLNNERDMYFAYELFATRHAKSISSLLNDLISGCGHLSSHVIINEDKNGEFSRKLYEQLTARYSHKA